MNSPHLLLASSNCRKLLQNLSGLLDPIACSRIEREIERNAVQLFHFGSEHFSFAKGLTRASWRQKISRYYYGAYNVRRAIQLYENGIFKTDVSDHQNINSFPDAFPNSSTYKVQLVTLRNDRNVADYGFDSSEADLVMPVADAESLVDSFIIDARTYFTSKNVTI